MRRTSSQLRTNQDKRLNLSVFIYAGLIVSTVSCASLERSARSGYAERNLYDTNQGRDRKIIERDLAMQELGIGQSSEVSDEVRAAIEDRLALRKIERTLVGGREREQYFKNSPYLKSDRERIEFLKIGTFAERERWLNAKGIGANLSTHPPAVQSLIEMNDIAVGFTKRAVRDSWGEPDLIEVAGNPVYGNERWHYREQTSSADGYEMQSRMIYFESGRVIGWESR